MKGVLKKAGNKSRSISIIKKDGKHERWKDMERNQRR
jgi:hypothetical protein